MQKFGGLLAQLLQVSKKDRQKTASGRNNLGIISSELNHFLARVEGSRTRPVTLGHPVLDVECKLRMNVNAQISFSRGPVGERACMGRSAHGVLVRQYTDPLRTTPIRAEYQAARALL